MLLKFFIFIIFIKSKTLIKRNKNKLKLVNINNIFKKLNNGSYIKIKVKYIFTDLFLYY